MLLLALLGCPDTEQTACDTMAAYSVTVSLVDGEGAPVTTASVNYTVDDGTATACQSVGGGDFVCGIEQAGHFVISATREGYVPVTGEADVVAGECHVKAEALELLLAACDDIPHAAFIVDLTAADGSVLENDFVESKSHNTDAAVRYPCAKTQGHWLCAWDDSGLFTVYANADGFAEIESSVDVPMDETGCHPDTQTIAMEFPLAE
ncbi:hypothetical protein LBMAG42_53250 [Deltaproteobacteria bacterium]|nr:hypothetical protein LBMAG42_53250 [Deltaproteobacteria bacterium]